MFRSTVHRLQTFVSINLFPSRLDNSAATLVNGWWIPSAIRTLALFSKFNRNKKQMKRYNNINKDVVNEELNRKFMSYNEFIIDLLDDIDMEFEYHLWLKRSKG
jgi:hypothetical protein